VALDTVETPFGRADNVLGGTAMYFSLAASLFTDVNLVGVVGEDFPGEALQTLQERRIDLAGLQRRSGETFRWVGQYDFDMNVAHTLDTQLNVFETFHPTIPDHYRDSRFVFLGNIHPSLQLEVLAQVTKPEFVALDTMNFWISGAKDELTQVMRRVDAVIINEGKSASTPRSTTFWRRLATFWNSVPATWCSSGASTARSSSRATESSRRPLSPPGRCATPRARAIASPAVLWDTWTAVNRWIMPASARRWSTAAAWRALPLKISAFAGS
jgi:hypothetical protein